MCCVKRTNNIDLQIYFFKHIMLVNIFSYTFYVSSLIKTYVRRRDPLTPNYKKGKNVSCQLTR